MTDLSNAAGSLPFPRALKEALRLRFAGVLSQAELIDTTYRWITSPDTWPHACRKQPLPLPPSYVPPPEQDEGEEEDEYTRRRERHDSKQRNRSTKWKALREHILSRNKRAREFLGELAQWAYDRNDDETFEKVAAKLKSEWGITDPLRLIRPTSITASETDDDYGD